MKAEYVDHMGDDLMVVNSARVSFQKHRESLSDGDVRLINYLARHEHWTPFGHPQITVRETVPVFIARQRFKHTVGFVYNEVSRRYVDDEPRFFYPECWRERPEGSIKQGSGRALPDQARWYSRYMDVLSYCETLYNNMTAAGVAPEQARMVLPQSMYTSYYVTGSLAAWARAYKQRIDATAQSEIQALARLWGEILSSLFPVSWPALTKGVDKG